LAPLVFEIRHPVDCQLVPAVIWTFTTVAIDADGWTVVLVPPSSVTLVIESAASAASGALSEATRRAACSSASARRLIRGFLCEMVTSADLPCCRTLLW
jgi:hypothetical protein